MHKTECTFYNLLGKEPIPLKVPKSYFNQEMAQNQPGFLVIQDLSDVLAQQYPGPGFTANQLMQVGDALAGLHAWCLNHQGWQGKFKLMDKKLFEKFPETNKIMFDRIKKEFPGVFDQVKIDAVVDRCKSIDDGWYIFTIHEEFKMPAILVHGDLWCGNLMFTKNADKDGNVSASDELLAIFDWQVYVYLLFF